MKRAVKRSGALMTAGLALAGCAGTTIPKRPPSPPVAKPTQASIAPDNLNVPANLNAAIKQAERQRKASNLEAATRTLGQLVLVAPNDPRVLGEYGKTLVDRGRTDDAIAFLKRAIELKPDDWTFYSAEGVAFDQRGRYKAAQDIYEQALQLKPADPAILSNAALSHMQAGDLADAEKLLREAVAKDSSNARIAANLKLVERLLISGAENVQAAPSPTGAVAKPQPTTVKTAGAKPTSTNAGEPHGQAASSSVSETASAAPSASAMPKPTPVVSQPLPDVKPAETPKTPTAEEAARTTGAAHDFTPNVAPKDASKKGKKTAEALTADAALALRPTQ